MGEQSGRHGGPGVTGNPMLKAIHSWLFSIFCFGLVSGEKLRKGGEKVGTWVGLYVKQLPQLILPLPSNTNCEKEK